MNRLIELNEYLDQVLLEEKEKGSPAAAIGAGLVGTGAAADYMGYRRRKKRTLATQAENLKAAQGRRKGLLRRMFSKQARLDDAKARRDISSLRGAMERTEASGYGRDVSRRAKAATRGSKMALKRTGRKVAGAGRKVVDSVKGIRGRGKGNKLGGIAVQKGPGMPRYRRKIARAIKAANKAARG